jgi:hypothetical protein
MINTIYYIVLTFYGIKILFFILCWYFLFKTLAKRESQKWDFLDYGVYTMFIFWLVELSVNSLFQFFTLLITQKLG